MTLISNEEMTEPARRLAIKFEQASKQNEKRALDPEDLKDLAVVLRWLSQESTDL